MKNRITNSPTIFLLIVCMLSFNIIYSQHFDALKECRTPEYLNLKETLVKKYKDYAPGKFGEFVKGVDEDLQTNKKMLALTFDACGGPHGSGFDSALIQYLKRNKIPATLFITGTWIDANLNEFLTLSHDTLFEIENHGLLHRPCTAKGESLYGIHGTATIALAIDEVELNARKILYYAKRKPTFYRSATAATDEECASLVRQLHEQIISFDVLSGDAVANTPAFIIQSNIISHAKPGAIIIMHMNHPEWNGYEALITTLPVFLKEGYTFVKLKDHPLKGRR